MDSAGKRLRKTILFLAGFIIPWILVFFLGDSNGILDEYEATASQVENNCVIMRIDGKDLGKIQSSKHGEEILARVRDYYINKSNIKKENILSTNIKNNITYRPSNGEASQIYDPEVLYKALIESNGESNPIIKVEIVYKGSFKEEIKPTTKFISSSELFVGDNKVSKKGESGQKEVVKQITINNAKVVSEKVISEKILVTPKDKVVLKGTKKPVATNTALFAMPSRGAITSNFGSRWGGEGHHGIDIAGNTGDPIAAAGSGIVNKVGWDSVYGKHIKIDHGNGVETLYGHCSELDVKVGDQIKKGDIIGKIGSTGRSTGSHLHFEVRINGITQNPVNYVR